MKKSKIVINEIHKEVLTKKGFDHRGCYGSPCKSACCRYGCEVDKESYNLIFKNKKLIEGRLGINLDDFFEKEWSNDKEYLGNNSVDTKTRNGYCVFKLNEAKGCILFELAFNKQVSKRIIPSICRLYPLTWGGGELMVTDDYEKSCNCIHKDNKATKNILETQIEHIKDIFRIEGKAKEIISS